jgi:hypothetical protein
MFCFADSWRKKRNGKKAKIWRGQWGAYEEEHGIGGRKNEREGEEIRGEKMYLGWISGLGTELG